MESIDLVKIGKFIAQQRKAKNLTQANLALLTGANDKTISRWETGISFPDLAYQKSLCDALDITYDELLRGSFNVEKRKKEKRKKRLNTIMLFFLIAFIPLFLFLVLYFFHSLGSIKLYKIFETDEENFNISGVYFQTNFYVFIYINDIEITNSNLLKTDEYSIELLADGEILNHYLSNESIIYVLRKRKANLGDLSMKIFFDSEVYDIDLQKNIGYYDNKSTTEKRFNFSEDKKTTEKRLKDNGFILKDDAYVKELSSTEILYYYLNENMFMYYRHSFGTSAKLIYYYSTNSFEVYVYNEESDIHEITDKYYYDIDTKELNCQIGLCSSLEKARKLTNDFSVLIFGELNS